MFLFCNDYFFFRCKVTLSSTIVFWLSFNSVVISNFTVKVAGSDIDYEGHVEIPNLSDENEADEVDVYCLVSFFFLYSLFFIIHIKYSHEL